ncbi:MAG: hypothetical protein IJL07_08880 [Lachnospiraceae bacterium]|nr:hypothetical protein [Lachnospiraceae bacterium]
MIDLSKISYRVVVMTEDGQQYNIKDFITNLGWEENEKEIAVRSSFAAKNDKTSKGYLSGIIKPGCVIGIFASDGNNEDEVARGYVETWNPSEKNSSNTLKCTNYDELYKLQKSQDNRYYPSGTGTKAAICGILDDWQIPQGSYDGPNVSHGKQVFNNRYLSDIILELLDDARKKGGEKCIIRSTKGKTSIIPRGSNTDIYVFQTDNSQMISQTVSTENLVTRVKVVGKADDDGQRSVEATLNGLTKYGIRQRIYTRGSDESLDDAKSAAQEILDNEGAIVKEMSIQSPDVPFIRKGDMVYVISGTSQGYYFVKSIQHNAEQYSMTMDLEIAKQESVTAENKTEDKKEYKSGDIVNFHGGTHYLSSYAGAKGSSARAGKAKITFDPTCKNNGKAHPWHLIHMDSESNVYGWVDDGTFD